MKGAIFVAMLVAVAMVQYMVRPGEATVSCGQVDSSLASCMPYLMSGGAPSGACCEGVKSIKANTPTTADRKAACSCVKEAAARYPNIKEDAASSLPQKCGIDMNIPISKNTNCDNIN